MRSSKHRTISRMLSCRRGLVAVGVLLLFASPLHVAQAQKSGRPIAVRAHYTEAFTLLGAQCNAESLESPQCGAIMGGLSYYTGSIAGTERFSCTTEGLPTDGKLRASCHAKFLAPTKVAGCGTGTFSFTANGDVDLTAFDPATQTFPGKGDWAVVAGSGTGDLRRLKGAGHIVWHLATTGDSYGDATGTVTC